MYFGHSFGMYCTVNTVIHAVTSLRSIWYISEADPEGGTGGGTSDVCTLYSRS